MRHFQHLRGGAQGEEDEEVGGNEDFVLLY